MTSTYLKINRGSLGTIDLNNPASGNIALLPGWRPAVSGRASGQLGGQVFVPAGESIPLRVFSLNKNPVAARKEVYETLQLLAEAMDQGWRWAREDNIEPAILEWRPIGAGVESATLNLQVGQSSDDGREDVGTGAMDLTTGNLRQNSSFYSAFRFTDSGAALGGVSVTAATLSINIDSGSIDDPKFYVYAEAVDDAATLTTTANDISDRPLTTARVTVDGTNVGTGWYDIDVTSVVQEIVNRPGWVAGNSICLVLVDSGAGGDVRFDSYDDTPANAPKLQVVYDTAGQADPMKSPILGGNGESLLGLAPTFNEYIKGWEVNPVFLNLTRDGEWLDEEEELVSSSAENPNKLTVTFTNDAKLPSPVKVKIGNFANDSQSLTEGYLILAENAADIVFVEAEVAGTGTTVDESANNARGDDVQEFPLATTYNGTAASMSLGTTLVHELVYIIGVARKTVASTAVYTYVKTKDAYGVENGATRPVVFDNSTTDPVVIPFGFVSSASADHTTLDLYYKCDTIAGVPKLRFDYFIVVGMDGETSRIVKHYSSSGSIDNFTIDPRTLVRPSPRVTSNNTVPQTRSVGYEGNAHLRSKGTSLTAVWVATRGSYWRFSDSSNNVVSNTLTATRRVAHVVVK